MRGPPPEPTRRDRTLGALLGVHAGDSLGATCEFNSWREVRQHWPNGVREIQGGGPFNWPAGHATDDTDLTRAVLLAYRDAEMVRRSRVENNSTLPNPDLTRLAAEHMLDWCGGRNWPGRTEGTSPVDIGGATALGLRNFQSTGDPKGGGAGLGSSGNGSLMRCIPSGLFFSDEEVDERELERQYKSSPDNHQEDGSSPFLVRITSKPNPSVSAAISAITHDDPLCVLSCAAYNMVVRCLVFGLPPLLALDVAESFLASLPEKLLPSDTPLNAPAMVHHGSKPITNSHYIAASGQVLEAMQRGRASPDPPFDTDPTEPRPSQDKPLSLISALATHGPGVTGTLLDGAIINADGFSADDNDTREDSFSIPPETDMLEPDGTSSAAKPVGRVIPHKAVGYVLDSLTVAVAALMDPRPLEDVLIDVVRIGGDTDTNGAIAGGLLGARDGVEAIPQRWREKLQFRSEFEEIVDYMLSE